MRLRTPALALLVASSLAVAGCGGDDETTTTTAASTPTTTAATTSATTATPSGDAIDTADASFASPSGWKQAGADQRKQIESSTAASGLEPLAILLPDGSSSSQPRSVLLVAKKAAPGAQAESDKDFEAFKKAVKSGFDSAARAGGTQGGATLEGDTEVAGAKALVLSFTQKSGSTELTHRQIIVAKGDAAYYLQATVPDSSQAGAARDALEQIRSSWQWK